MPLRPLRGALVVAALSLATVARAQFGPPPVDIPVPNLLQETPVWCWAAVAQQIIVHAAGRDRTPPQCALVAMANGAPPQACCGSPNPACVRTGSLPQIQGLIQAFGGRFSTQAPPADPMTLYRTLSTGRPIVLLVRTGVAASHVVVLRGMSFVPGPAGLVPVLHINDPLQFFTQPVPFFQLVPYWMGAIVVEPGDWRGVVDAEGPVPRRTDGRVASPSHRRWSYEYKRIGGDEWRRSISFGSRESCQQSADRKNGSDDFLVRDCEEVDDE